jgi:hypothetical protein
MFGTIATPAFASSATDLICTITDSQGSKLYYTFDGNTHNANGTDGGTMVETGFEKNGISVMSEVGQRPIWIWNSNRSNGVTLWSREAPGWFIGTANMRTVNGWWSGRAELYHNSRFAGSGECTRYVGGVASNGGVTASNVGDQGPVMGRQRRARSLRRRAVP